MPEATIEGLQQEIEGLKTRLEFVEKCQSHYHATFEDNNETIRGFAERINEFGKRAEDLIVATDSRLQKAFIDAINSFNTTLLSSFEAEVAKDVVARISSETIADSLSKRVLVKAAQS